MTVKLRTIVICAIISVAVIAGIFLLNQPEPAGEPSVIYLVGGDGDFRISSVSIQNSADSYSIERTDNGYVIPELKDAKINQGLADNLFYSLEKLQSSSLAPEGKADSYGLENPQATVLMTSRDGKTRTLFIGGKSGILGEYFVTTDAHAGKTYLMAPYCAELIKNDVNAYRNMMFIDFVYDSDYEKLEYVEMSGENIVTLSLTNDETDGFSLAEPISYPCIQTELKDNFLNHIVHLSGDTYSGTAAGEQMGFGEPDYTIKMRYKNHDIELLIGNALGGSRYVKRRDSEDIYMVSSDKLGFLKFDYRKAVGSSLYFRSIAAISGFSVRRGNDLYDFELEKDADTYAAKMNGRYYSGSEIIPVYNRVIGLPMLNKIDTANEGEDDEVIIVVSLLDGRQDTVRLARLNEREYSVTVNGNCEFSTYSENVEDLWQKLRQLL